METSPRIWVAACSLLVPFGALAAVATAPSAVPAPLSPGATLFFTGETLPEPPQQQASWLPPATLHAATRELFAQGLADPRGGEYREVEVVTRGSNGPGSLTRAHAPPCISSCPAPRSLPDGSRDSVRGS